MTTNFEERKPASFRVPKDQLELLLTLVKSGKFDSLTAVIEKAVQNFIKTESGLNPDTVVAILPRQDYVKLLKMHDGYAAEGVKTAVQEYITNFPEKAKRRELYCKIVDSQQNPESAVLPSVNPENWETISKKDFEELRQYGQRLRPHNI